MSMALNKINADRSWEAVPLDGASGRWLKSAGTASTLSCTVAEIATMGVNVATEFAKGDSITPFDAGPANTEDHPEIAAD